LGGPRWPVKRSLFLHVCFCVSISETGDVSWLPFLLDARFVDNVRPFQSQNVEILPPGTVDRLPQTRPRFRRSPPNGCPRSPQKNIHQQQSIHQQKSV